MSSDPVALLKSRFFKYFSTFSFVGQGTENSVSFGTCSLQNFFSRSKFGCKVGSFSLEATLTKNLLNSLAISRGSVYSLPSTEIVSVVHFDLFFVAPSSLNIFQTFEG